MVPPYFILSIDRSTFLEATTTPRVNLPLLPSPDLTPRFCHTVLRQTTCGPHILRFDSLKDLIGLRRFAFPLRYPEQRQLHRKEEFLEPFKKCIQSKGLPYLFEKLDLIIKGIDIISIWSKIIQLQIFYLTCVAII